MANMVPTYLTGYLKWPHQWLYSSPSSAMIPTQIICPCGKPNFRNLGDGLLFGFRQIRSCHSVPKVPRKIRSFKAPILVVSFRCILKCGNQVYGRQNMGFWGYSSNEAIQIQAMAGKNPQNIGANDPFLTFFLFNN